MNNEVFIHLLIKVHTNNILQIASFPTSQITEDSYIILFDNNAPLPTVNQVNMLTIAVTIPYRVNLIFNRISTIFFSTIILELFNHIPCLLYLIRYTWQLPSTFDNFYHSHNFNMPFTHILSFLSIEYIYNYRKYILLRFSYVMGCLNELSYQLIF